MVIDLIPCAFLIATLFVPWTRTGNGSLAGGSRLAGMLIAVGHPLAAAAVVAIGISGLALLVLVLGDGRITAAVRIAIAVSVVALLAILLVGGLLPVGQLGPAPIAAACAAAFVLSRNAPSPRRASLTSR